MNNKSRTIINLICSMMVMITNLLIGFVLSPYIVRNIGVEANGFVTLASNFVTYASLIVTALNSMAARYITISYVQKDFKRANLYYNSVFWGNLLIVAVLVLPALFFIVKMETIIDVPPDIAIDVKILFAFVFFNFFISTGLPNWDCGTYVTNRLDRSYIPNVFASVIRCACIFLMMSLLTPKVWYVGFAATILTVITLIVNCYNTHTLTPELRIRLSGGKPIYSLKAIWKLVGSGIWNSISSVGNMLLSGLDLIIANMALGATAMGVLSLSKTLPHLMQQLSSSICNAFAPELTINYAKGDMKAVLKDINRAMKLTSVIMTVPFAGIVVLCDRFYQLWVPSQDAALLQALTILSILGYMFTSGTQILYNVFSTVNKVKENAIAMLLSGVVSTALTLLLVHYTQLGIYAVAGVSVFVCLVRNMVFTVPMTAKYLGYHFFQFYPQVGRTILSSGLLIGAGFVVKPFLPQGSWGSFIISTVIVGILGLLINVCLLLNRSERAFLSKIVLRKLNIRKKTR